MQLNLLDSSFLRCILFVACDSNFMTIVIHRIVVNKHRYALAGVQYYHSAYNVPEVSQIVFLALNHVRL